MSFFYKFKERPFNKVEYYLSYDGAIEVDRKLKDHKYKCRKIYEDKIYNIKMLI